MRIRLLQALVPVFLLLSGCANLAQQAGNRLATDLAAAMQDHPDPDTVAEAMPAYLLLMDAMARGNGEDAATLFNASRLYATFAGNFVQDSRRAAVLASHARAYADRALCLRWKPWCERAPDQRSELIAALDTLPQSRLHDLYQTAVAWATWAQTHAEDWNAVAEIPLIQAMFQQVLKQDPKHDQGRVHLYLAVLNTLLPPAYGGKPEVAKAHFEQALALSKGHDLMAKVLYARHYARLVFDQPLHDRLLREVLEADAQVPGMTLSNLLAQRQARILLQQSGDYF